MFSSALVSLFVSRIMQKRLNWLSQKFGGKVAHGPRQKPLDFGGNPDHVTLGLELSINQSSLLFQEHIAG